MGKGFKINLELSNNLPKTMFPFSLNFTQYQIYSFDRVIPRTQQTSEMNCMSAFILSHSFKLNNIFLFLKSYNSKLTFIYKCELNDHIFFLLWLIQLSDLGNRGLVTINNSG